MEGQQPSNVSLQTIIEDLGTIPPWQACYLDPKIGVVIHIFTAKREIPDLPTRKANNYYAVYVDSDATSFELISGLSTRLEERIRLDESSWVEVESKDLLKSKLSDPELIFSLSAESTSPQTLSECGFIGITDTYSNEFCLTFDDINKLLACFRLAVSQNIPTVYATERKAVDVPELTVSLEFGNTNTPKKEAQLLEDKVRKIANQRQNHHIDRLSKRLGKVNTAISKGGVKPAFVLPSYRSLRDSVRNGEPIDTGQMNKKELYSLASTIENIRTDVLEETSEDMFDSLSKINPNKEEYKINVEKKVVEAIQKEIDTLITRLITDASSDIIAQVESKAANIAKNTGYTTEYAQDLVYTHLSYVEPTESTLFGSIINSISTDSKPDHNSDIVEASSNIESYIEAELLPRLTNQTGLTANEVDAKLTNTLSDQIEF